MIRRRLYALAGALALLASTSAAILGTPSVAQAQQPTAPQFGGPLSADWPPVFSGEIQATVGNAVVLLGLVGNRTDRQHAFVDVRWAIPSGVRVVDTYAGTPGIRGKLEGLSANLQQVGWINHYVRAGQVQGPFYVLLENTSGRAFQTWSWMWFSTADQSNRRNGNYTSRGVTAGGAPLGWSAEWNTAAGGAGLPGGVGGR